MSKIWVTSDLHIGHKKICEYTDRKLVVYQDLHDQWLVDLWNSQVSKNDTVIQCGDFVFNCRDFNKWQSVVSQLNGKIIHIAGNHDSHEVLRKSGHEWYDLRTKTFPVGGVKRQFVFCHYAMRVWQNSHHGSIHCFGHCLDEQTEVLTKSGWKSRQEVSLTDEIATFNLETSGIEYSYPTDKFEYDYNGKMFSYESSRVDMCVTPNHRIVYNYFRKEGKWKVKEISNMKGQFVVPSCGVNTKPDYPIEDEWLKLYVHICTDGSFENNRGLVRFHLKKERKIKVLCELLETLSIPYSRNTQKTGNTKINFRTPKELENLQIKPADRELLMNLSKRQVDIVLDTYEITDGSRTGRDSVQICTGKEEEANLIQEMLVTSGVSCNLVKTRKETYILSVNTHRVRPSFKTDNLQELEYSGKVWCLSVPNTAFVVRRNGKVHITGNSHGGIKEQHGKSLDVGLDSSYNYFGKHKFFSLEEIVEIADQQGVATVDHHTERTSQ